MTKPSNVTEFKSDEDSGLQIKEGNNWRTIASYVDVIGVANVEGSDQQLLVIKFETESGVRELLHPRADQTKPSAILRELVGRGYAVPSLAADKNKLYDFLARLPSPSEFNAVRRTGYCGRSYVRSDGAIIPKEAGGSIILLPNQNDGVEPARIIGNIQGWSQEVGKLAKHSSPMMFGISVSFASLLMKFSGDESGMFHLYGRSSVGKSLIQLVATSVHRYAARDRLPHWDVTETGLEELAAQHCDSLLVLDDTGHLANEQSAAAAKARATAYKLTSGKARIRSSVFKGGVDVGWRLLGLSSGEVPIESFAEARGGRLAGETVRLIDVPAVVSEQHGIFDKLPAGVAAHELARQLEAGCERHAGVAAVSFIEALYKIEVGEVTNLIEQWIEKFMVHAAVPKGGWERRFARRFALAYAGARFAREFDIVTWEKSESLAACMSAYQAARMNVSGGEALLAKAVTTVTRRLSKSKHKVDITSQKRRDLLTAKQVAKASAYVVRSKRYGDFFAIPTKTLLRWTEEAVPISVLAARLRNQGHLLPHGNVLTRQVKVPHQKERRRYYCLKVSILKA